MSVSPEIEISELKRGLIRAMDELHLARDVAEAALLVERAEEDGSITTIAAGKGAEALRALNVALRRWDQR